MAKSVFSENKCAYDSASSAVVDVINRIIDEGEDVEPASSGSTLRSGTGSTELLGHSFVLSNPLDRLYNTDRKSLNLPVAIARFVWMMSGSNRLADIAFYEPNVERISDDQFTVPGSSYGQRIFQSSPGIDQLRSVIDRIKNDPNTRRATVSIYQPTDATRDSKDIPCTFGLMYHPRNSTLNAMTIMRSNNAGGLLEFNIFEFSLLAEVVASEAGLELGELLHFAGSMHVFDRTIDAWKKDGPATPIGGRPMQQMPRHVSALDQITELIRFEAEMRHNHTSIRGALAQEWISKVQSGFDPYWQQFAFVLLIAVAKKNQDVQFWDQLVSHLSDEYKPFFGPFNRPDSSSEQEQDDGQQKDLFSGFDDAPKIKHLIVPEHNEKIVEFVDAWEKKTKKQLSHGNFVQVQQLLLERIAARGLDGVISQEDFDKAVEDVSDNPENDE